MLAWVWGLFDQNIGLNQIHKDWHLLSVAAKYLGESKVFYLDQRKIKNVSDDRKLLEFAHALLSAADIFITQNGINFDLKKLNARFIILGMEPVPSAKHIDTLRLAKKNFAFTSNKLEYMSGALSPELKKDDHKNFPGFELWKECLLGNIKAWREMEKYNKQDVLALEAVYKRLAPWGTPSVNWNIFDEDEENPICQCGSREFKRNGSTSTNTAIFARYRCKKCGYELRERKNLLAKKKKMWLKTGTSR